MFDDYTEEERNSLFGIAPPPYGKTSRDSINILKRPRRSAPTVLFHRHLWNSFVAYAVNQWKTELHDRIIPDYMGDIRSYKLIHGADATGL